MSSRGILATGVGKDDVQKLNERVKLICEKKVKESRDSKTPLPADIQAALKPGNGLTSIGYPIYRERSELMVYCICLFALAGIVVGVAEKGFVRTLVYLAVMFVGYDFYSGILHVVLDEPANIPLPVLGQPCLEFQWHHYIPNDITSKSLSQACGDLNVAGAILLGVHMVFSGFFNPDRTVSTLLCIKVLCAYFGQFSHRTAHNPFAFKSAPLAFLQKTGIMISAKDHKAHHKPPHDKDFCLIGICNPLFDFLNQSMLKLGASAARWTWLVLFLAWSVVDIPVIAWAVTATVG